MTITGAEKSRLRTVLNTRIACSYPSGVVKVKLRLFCSYRVSLAMDPAEKTCQVATKLISPEFNSESGYTRMSIL
jgi:hypothetical protein